MEQKNNQEKNGKSIECSVDGCHKRFHVTCAIKAGLIQAGKYSNVRASDMPRCRAHQRDPSVSKSDGTAIQLKRGPASAGDDLPAAASQWRISSRSLGCSRLNAWCYHFDLLPIGSLFHLWLSGA